MKEHILKIETEYFAAVELGIKTFEIRLNDRDFKRGDFVTLKEYVKEIDQYTGRQITKKIGFVTNFAQRDGYVVFSLLEMY